MPLSHLYTQPLLFFSIMGPITVPNHLTTRPQINKSSDQQKKKKKIKIINQADAHVSRPPSDINFADDIPDQPFSAVDTGTYNDPSHTSVSSPSSMFTFLTFLQSSSRLHTSLNESPCLPLLEISIPHPCQKYAVSRARARLISLCLLNSHLPSGHFPGTLGPLLHGSS